MKLKQPMRSCSWLALMTGALLPAALTMARVERPQASDDLQAVLWVQHAAEYQAICQQTFATATRQLPVALAEDSRTAAIEQFGTKVQQLPPAVIVDVDETMLDNSPYNARLIQDDKAFTPETWAAWVEERKAEPIRGALAFANRATALGITVFYVTNRDVSLQDATHDNLQRHGFPVSKEQLLMRNEVDQDGSEKRNRRAHVAATHRVLMLLGDDLGDFVAGSRSASAEQRSELRKRYESLFGERWFVLPNPIYGSWTKSLDDDKRASLRTHR